LIKSRESTDSYKITDGDIPCTPETEPSFNYVWNFCSNVPSGALPDECKAVGKNAAVLQYANYGESERYCYIVGHYDQYSTELTYNLLDVKDPSKGISLKYPTGENCDLVPRSATIDIMCANTASAIISAQEPTTCQYHMVMKSYYGCPTVSNRVFVLLSFTSFVLSLLLHIIFPPSNRNVLSLPMAFAILMATVRTTPSPSSLTAIATMVGMALLVTPRILEQLHMMVSLFN
jgi:hypothetical protein